MHIIAECNGLTDIRRKFIENVSTNFSRELYLLLISVDGEQFVQTLFNITEITERVACVTELNKYIRLVCKFIHLTLKMYKQRTV